MSATLPASPSMEHLRKQAKALLKSAQSGDSEALAGIAAHFPGVPPSDLALRHAQLTIARDYGFTSWAKLKGHVDAQTASPSKPDRVFRRDIDYFEDRAFGFHSVVQSGLPEAIEQARQAHPRYADPSVPIAGFSMDDARMVVARQHGFPDWEAFSAYVNDLATGVRQEPFEQAYGAMEALDFPRFKSIIEANPEIVNARGTNGNDVLGLAISLTAKAEPNADGPFPFLHFLLDAGANVNAANDRGWTALHQAGYSNNVALADFLLARGALVTPSAHGDGGTPLMAALFWGNLEAADRLAREGVLPKNLRAAAGLGAMELLRSLLHPDGTLAPEAGAHRAFYRPHSGFPVWHPSNNPKEIIDEALVYAAKSGRLEAIEYLLDHGADIDAEPYNATALHWAARQQPEAVKLLLRRGANVHRQAAFGGVACLTPLNVAGWSGNVESAKALLEGGADVAWRDPEHHGFAFGWADYAGQKEAKRYLLEVGSKTNLFHAIAGKRMARARALLDADPSLLNRDDGHNTPLTYAASHGRKEMVELLLARGADPTLRDSRGHSAREVALEDGHQDIADLLP